MNEMDACEMAYRSGMKNGKEIGAEKFASYLKEEFLLSRGCVSTSEFIDEKLKIILDKFKKGEI